MLCERRPRPKQKPQMVPAVVTMARAHHTTWSRKSKNDGLNTALVVLAQIGLKYYVDRVARSQSSTIMSGSRVCLAH